MTLLVAITSQIGTLLMPNVRKQIGLSTESPAAAVVAKRMSPLLGSLALSMTHSTQIPLALISLTTWNSTKQSLSMMEINTTKLDSIWSLTHRTSVSLCKESPSEQFPSRSLEQSRSRALPRRYTWEIVDQSTESLFRMH